MSEAGESLWKTLPLGRGVQLLERDRNGLVALAKPAGILSHPNGPGDESRSLLNARYNLEGEYFEWTHSGPMSRTGPAVPPEPAVQGEPKTPFRLWLLNRLDSATSGVILAASNEELANAIKAQFKKKKVRKVYQALVFGAPRRSSELWNDRLAVSKEGGHIRTEADRGSVAESRVSSVRTGRGQARVSLLKLEPLTGKSHQLRVQCAKRGLPIVGDQTYGDFARNREFSKVSGHKRLFLHSLETSFEYEYAGSESRFFAHASLPPEFEEYL
jgi:23S rRNA-/tRNA-specific pseudouridylate synthase